MKKTKTVRNSASHQYDPNDPQFAPLLDPDGRPLAGLSAGLTAVLTGIIGNNIKGTLLGVIFGGKR